jgi:hypothetical protein
VGKGGEGGDEVEEGGEGGRVEADEGWSAREYQLRHYLSHQEVGR